jgi:hypothetical protein
MNKSIMGNSPQTPLIQEKEMQNYKKGGERVHLKKVCFWLSDQAKNYKMTITSLISLVKNLGKRGKNEELTKP